MTLAAEMAARAVRDLRASDLESEARHLRQMAREESDTAEATRLRRLAEERNVEASRLRWEGAPDSLRKKEVLYFLRLRAAAIDPGGSEVSEVRGSTDPI